MHESEKWKWSRSVVSDSQRPHGLQPTRLLCPWDFPGKSTGVGCHCLLRITELVNRKSKIYTLVYQFPIHILLIAMTKYCSILSFLWGEWYKNVKELFLLIRNHKAVHLNASTKSSEATWQYDIFKRTVLFPKQKRKSLKAIFLVSVSNFGLEIFVLKCVKL